MRSRLRDLGRRRLALNPPPGWPPMPKGWIPPVGWSPPGDWPSAPPGWAWWRTEVLSYRLYVFDVPVVRDWLFWLMAGVVLLTRPGLGSSADAPDWMIFGYPRAGDPLWVTVLVGAVLVAFELVLFTLVPGVARRLLREREFQRATSASPMSTESP